MIHSELHKKILKNLDKLNNWFSMYQKKFFFPVTSSFDMRDSSYKVANVDANIFPAGINNICSVDKENAPTLMNSYLNSHYGQSYQKILILTEEHTKNISYWDNIKDLSNIIKKTGRKIYLSIPRTLAAPVKITCSNGEILELLPFQKKNFSIEINGIEPDLIINNNDFSFLYEDWAYNELKIPMNPPKELGWYQRRKHRYFESYNHLAEEFSHLIASDPWLIQVKTELFTHFDLDSSEKIDELADLIEKVKSATKDKYVEYKLHQEPFVFIKSNAGTYGMGVARVTSGKDIKEWNNKMRKKMKTTKSGRYINEVIVQEGIPSSVRVRSEVAEPTIYMIGSRLAGGFLRSHSEKDSTENLNSPGANFQRLCLSDLEIDMEGLPMENVYGWLAKIGTLAIGREINEMQVHFRSYQKNMS